MVQNPPVTNKSSQKKQVDSSLNSKKPLIHPCTKPTKFRKSLTVPTQPSTPKLPDASAQEQFGAKKPSTSPGKCWDFRRVPRCEPKRYPKIRFSGAFQMLHMVSLEKDYGVRQIVPSGAGYWWFLKQKLQESEGNRNKSQNSIDQLINLSRL